MAPEYGATMGFFGVDEKTLDYFRATGRTDAEVETIRNYYTAQEMFGIPLAGEVEYTTVLDLDLSTIVPALAGPKRPQDRINLDNLAQKFTELFSASVADGGFGKTSNELTKRSAATLNASGNLPIYGQKTATATATEVGHGDVLIAAITSCTNTSNPSVMLAAGIVAKKAATLGMKVPAFVKTSLGPGSRVVTKYLEATGLQKYLDEMGFNTVGYGCTVCIGNSGPLDAGIEKAITDHDLVACSVLSGNRNFEARVHQNIKANFLASPPLVVAFALAGNVTIDISKDPVGKDRDGNDVYLKDIWATTDEVAEMMKSAFDAETYRRLYGEFAEQNPLWNSIPSSVGLVYEWDDISTYIQNPPFFENFSMETGEFSNISGARALAIFGDSVTTDHISPAGAIKPSSPAGKYLQEKGVEVSDFNSYGSRRGNDRVMLRGTFANVRIKNLMVSPKEGGLTIQQPGGDETFIYDAAMNYKAEGVPTIIFGGQEYGTGSSRDWAAKGTYLMGVKAVITQSFERIHRSNLVGMGVLPLQFKDGVNAGTLKLDGTETFDLSGLDGDVTPSQDVILRISRTDGTSEEVALTLRIDTPIELEYYKGGGILQFVLRQLLSQ